jgi:predicted small lipoprotein YifL
MRSGFFIGILIIAITLQGCGRKGPLRLPDHHTQAPAPVIAPDVPKPDTPQDAPNPGSQTPNTPSIQPTN